jgi:hypothetical protein
MDVVTLIPLQLVDFHLDAMRIRPSVLTDASDLPGNFTPDLLVLMVKLPLVISDAIQAWEGWPIVVS